MIKIGSLVECIDDLSQESANKTYILDYPKKRITYTVKSFIEVDGRTYISLEEIFIGPCNLYGEIHVNIIHFRELEIPPSIELEIQEALTKPLIELQEI